MDDTDDTAVQILGIDPGLKNLGLCLLRPGNVPAEDQIVFWKSCEVSSNAAALVHDLDRILKDMRMTQIVIEKQPPKNPSMKRLENFLEMYFAVRMVPVSVTHARNKLAFASTTPYWGKNSTLTYAARKKAAIDVVGKYLAASDIIAEDHKRAFAESKKRDDLADALLTAQSFVHSIKPRKFPRSRAPPPGSTRRLLTAANVVHFLKTSVSLEDIDAMVEENTKLKRAVHVHFTSTTLFYQLRKDAVHK